MISCLQLRYDILSSNLNSFFLVPNLQNKYWGENKYLATFYFSMFLVIKIGNFRNVILQRDEKVETYFHCYTFGVVSENSARYRCAREKKRTGRK